MAQVLFLSSERWCLDLGMKVTILMRSEACRMLILSFATTQSSCHASISVNSTVLNAPTTKWRVCQACDLIMGNLASALTCPDGIATRSSRSARRTSSLEGSRASPTITWQNFECTRWQIPTRKHVVSSVHVVPHWHLGNVCEQASTRLFSSARCMGHLVEP